VLHSDHHERLESERAFHNERIMEESRTHQNKYYVAIKKAQEAFSQLIRQNALNKDVLEIGCFDGYAAEEISKYAKSYTGIDISDIAIEKANEGGG